NDTLLDIKSADKPVLLVFNKIDQYLEQREQEMQEESGNDEEGEHHVRPSIEDLKATYMAKIHAPALFISATNRINIDELRAELQRRVAEIHFERYPNNV
ncbi:GTP-binding protein HflX, partial [Pontibacter sp. BAB1700]